MIWLNEKIKESILKQQQQQQLFYSRKFLNTIHEGPPHYNK